MLRFSKLFINVREPFSQNVKVSKNKSSFGSDMKINRDVYRSIAVASQPFKFYSMFESPKRISIMNYENKSEDPFAIKY